MVHVKTLEEGQHVIITCCVIAVCRVPDARKDDDGGFVQGTNEIETKTQQG